MGFFIVVVMLIERFLYNRYIKIVLISIIVIFLSLATYGRNTIWKGEQTLWEDVIHKSPNNVRAYNELGAIFRDEGKYDRASELFEKALKINSNYSLTYYNLGFIQYKYGNYEDALKYFRQTLKLKLTPQIHMDVLNSMGMTYSAMGKDNDAVIHFKDAIRILPASIIAYNNLGLQYIKMGKFEEAIEMLEKGLKIREESHLRYNLTVAYAKKIERDRNVKETKK